MPRRSDLVGKRFGRLVVLEPSFTKYTKLHWKCLCDCGNITNVQTEYLTHGNTKSCGCLQREILSNIGKEVNTTHGQTNTRLFNLWSKIKSRCYCKGSSGYHNYGGRGIIMCDEWKNDFLNFKNWAIKNGYREEILPNGRNKLTIDRIDNNGNYEPNNCRWTTYKQQARNKRTNKIYEYNGKQLCLSELAEICGLGKNTLRYRLEAGYPIEKAMFTKSRRDKGGKQYGTK